MTTKNLSTLTDDALVEQFAKCGEVRGEAIIEGDVPRATRAAYQMRALDQEFHRRGALVRALLLPLLEGHSYAVRYYAGLRLLSSFPIPARTAIASVPAEAYSSIAAEARGTLRRWDSGELSPDWCP